MRPSSLVQDHLAPWNSATTSRGEVVGRRAEPAARDHERIPSRGEPVERGAHVLGPVADDDRVRVVDAELAQPLRQPRAVAVAHAAGEDLGAGDDDAGAGAHAPQVGAGRRWSSRRPVG